MRWPMDKSGDPSIPPMPHIVPRNGRFLLNECNQEKRISPKWVSEHDNAEEDNGKSKGELVGQLRGVIAI